MDKKKVRSIKVEEVGIILQQLYDSEIDMGIAWIWDGGFQYVIENQPYPFEVKWKGEPNFTSDKITDCLEWICTDVLIKYPEGGFSKWLKEEGFISDLDSLE